MIDFIGRNGNLALFSNGSDAAVINTDLNLVVGVGDTAVLSTSRTWESTDEEFSPSTLDLAASATTSLDINVITASGRAYTVPDGVKAEAQKALDWHKEHHRGGTPVGLNTARILAKGGQIGLAKIRHIAKYFPRHEVDKKGKGWKPGQDQFPSNGRIAWALWGGDAAWKWSKTIVERENKKALTAGGYALPGYQDSLETYQTSEDYGSDLGAFKMAQRLEPENTGPEFIIRVRLDGSGIDRLYKVDSDDSVKIWDDCSWDDMGHADNNIWSYDSSLDSEYDTVGKTHVIVDPESAMIISALMQQRPMVPVQLEDIDSDESMLMAEEMADLDYELINSVITAAGVPVDSKNIKTSPASTGSQPGYTPQERSQNAQEQVRDGSGRFSTSGSRVTVGGDTNKGVGTITKVDQSTGKVDVKLDDGRTITLDAKYTRAYDPNAPHPGAFRMPNPEDGPLDVSGILGEPRTPSNQPKAHLPGTLPSLTKDGIQKMLTNWTKYVSDMRKSYAPKGPIDKAEAQKRYGVTKFAKPTTASALIAAIEEATQTPENTDVPPKYLALVSPDDPRAVMDLVALVPKTATSTTPTTYKRSDGQWVLDTQVLKDLTSATPPPVIELDNQEIVNDVLTQVDKSQDDTRKKKPEPEAAPAPVSASIYQHVINFWSESDAITAAGGADRNRGNADKLRRYWTHGKGAAKIRWGTKGDWARCVRHLSKYMGEGAKGYCQLRHKDALGFYTSTHAKMDKKQHFANEEAFIEKVVQQSYLNARANEARARFSLTAGADVKIFDGAKFSIPVVLPEEVESGDGRSFHKNSVEIRELPLPLLWQYKTGEGHSGSVVVGRIDYMERIGNGIGNATGVFDTGTHGAEAERLVRNGFLRGVSADLDQFEAKESKSKGSSDELGDELGKDKLKISHARVMAVTIVPKPAFQECTISIVNDANKENNMPTEDGVYEESVDNLEAPTAVTASGFLSAPIPAVPPADWFVDPKLDKPTPLTISEDGRVFGHIAAWHVNHIGLPNNTKPPRSRSNYGYFHTGLVRTDSGKDIPVGQLTLAGGHASLHASAQAAAKHYDDTASAIADVHAGEDKHGIWVAGSLRPEATESQIRSLRASAPSGDWRPVGGSLELVAVCQVNVPGFPIARALMASGSVVALVAAGAYEMAMLRNDAASKLSAKADALGALSASVETMSIRERIEAKRLDAEFGYIPRAEREELAKKGFALPDGSFPIKIADDVKAAIHAYGRAKPSHRAAVRKHIEKRARALKVSKLIPTEWKSAASNEAFSALETMRSKIEAMTAAGEAPQASDKQIQDLIDAKKAADAEQEQIRAEIKARKEGKAPAGSPIRAEVPTSPEAATPAQTEVPNGVDTTPTPEAGQMDETGKYIPGKTQPRDATGQFRKVLARLKQDLGVSGLQEALKQVEHAENLEFAGNYTEAAGAASDLLGTLDRLDTGALDATKIDSVRTTAAALGKVISNLPLPFNNQAQKVRFSDLPPALKDLMKTMVERVEKKVGKKDAGPATATVKSFMSGSDVYSQSEISSHMSTLLRLLT